MKTACYGCEHAEIKLYVIPRPPFAFAEYSIPKIEEFIFCQKKYRNVNKPIDKCKDRTPKKRRTLDSYK